MKFTVDYPIVLAGHDSGLVTAEGMTRVAQAAEECGYDALQRSGGLSGAGDLVDHVQRHPGC